MRWSFLCETASTQPDLTEGIHGSWKLYAPLGLVDFTVSLAAPSDSIRLTRCPRHQRSPPTLRRSSARGTGNARRDQLIATYREFGALDAWPTWVLSNHDHRRHRTRFGSEETARAAEAVQAEAEQEIEGRTLHRQSLEKAHQHHQETRKKLARRLMADAIPPDVYRQLEEEEEMASRAIEREMATLEAPPVAPDLDGVLAVLESVTWEALDAEAWQEVVALLVEKVEVSGLGDYGLIWSPVGESLGRVLAGVKESTVSVPSMPGW